MPNRFHFFEKAVQSDPLKVYSLYNLGFSKFKLGDVEKGLELINQSLELDKGNSYAYKNKGIIFLEQGNKTEARRNFMLAVKFGYNENYGDEVKKLLKRLD